MNNDRNLPEPALEPPPEPPMPRCPICGEETDTFYKNMYLEIVGCDWCVYMDDAWKETREERTGKK